MVRHTILIKARTDISSEMIDNVISHFCDLKNSVHGITTIVGGACNFHDEKSSNFFSGVFSHGISIDFKDQAAYDAFLSDRSTLPAKNKILDIAQGEYDGLVGFDFF